jgi:hypothetical protein
MAKVEGKPLQERQMVPPTASVRVLEAGAVRAGPVSMSSSCDRTVSGRASPSRAPGQVRDAIERLSTIIDALNERFGTEFDAQDLVDGVTAQLVSDERIQTAARNNRKDGFAYVFNPALDDALIDRHGKHGDFVDKVFSDEQLGRFFRTLMLDQVYERLTGYEAGRGSRSG